MLEGKKPALRELVEPRAIEDFFSNYWPDKATYFVSEGEVTRLPGFLRSKELSSFKALWQANKGRVAFTSGPTSVYMLPVDQQYAANLYDMGLTIYFENIARALPGADDFARQLEMDLGINKGSVRLGAWVSPKENGAGCHYDADDTISIQLQGTKRFELATVAEVPAPYGTQYSPETGPPRENLYPQMVKGFPHWKNAEFQTVEMKPGTVLFFPRGIWHRTLASADSLAVTIALRPATAVDCLLKLLRLLMIQDSRWRKPIYGAWGNGQERQLALSGIAELLAEIPRIGHALSPEDVILPTLSLEERITLIDRNSRFQRLPSTQISVEQQRRLEADTLQSIRIIMAYTSGKQTLSAIEVPRQYVDVVKWIADQSTPFYAHALESKFPEISFGDHKRLLEICIQGGLLALLWFPALNHLVGEDP